jgi:hypothetical protein
MLKDRTGNSPNGVRRALHSHPDLARAIKRLNEIEQRIDQYRKISSLRFIVSKDPKFREALQDFKLRWKNAYDDLYGWYEESGKIFTLDDLFDEPSLLHGPQEELSAESAAESITGKQKSDANAGEYENSGRFDPERDNIADIIELLEQSLRDYPVDASDDWKAEGLIWLRETVGLNFRNLHKRWREFPVIAVPEQVAEGYSVDGKDGLFGYLNQVRRAYIVEADLAAIALCRSITELLIRYHYASYDEKTKDMPLNLLIKDTQSNRKFDFLKRLNLIEKVKEANKILHNPRHEEITHKDPARGLVQIWITALEEMISKAPSRSAAGY